jgi:hypothetical protein
MARSVIAACLLDGDVGVLLRSDGSKGSAQVVHRDA